MKVETFIFRFRLDFSPEIERLFKIKKIMAFDLYGWFVRGLKPPGKGAIIEGFHLFNIK